MLRANQKRPGGSARDQFEREALTHLDALFAVGVRLTRSHTEGEDLVQDTLVKAMRSRARFAAGTNMRAWLLKILTNTFINRYRRAGLEKSVFDGFFRVFNRGFEVATDRFMVLAVFFTTKVGRSLALLALIVAGTVVLFRAVPGGFVPEEDQGYVMAAFMLPDAASLQRTREVMREVDAIVRLPHGAEAEMEIGGRYSFEGTLSRCDPAMRNLFVTGARLV